MTRSNRNAPTSALYVSAGLLIWLAVILLRRAVVAFACGGTEPPATVGLTAVPSVLGAVACAWLLYYALGAARAPAGAVHDRARMVHFIAGGVAALGLVGIGYSAILGTLAARCPMP
jgi:hypothetical protein